MNIVECENLIKEIKAFIRGDKYYLMSLRLVGTLMYVSPT